MARNPKQQRPSKEPTPDADESFDGDVALPFARDRHGVHVLRRRSASAPVEAGLIAPLREGKPISGEVVSLRRRPDVPFVFDVKSELEAAEPPRATGDGPAQVASDAYRKGWDAVWGNSRRRDRSVN